MDSESQCPTSNARKPRYVRKRRKVTNWHEYEVGLQDRGRREADIVVEGLDARGGGGVILRRGQVAAGDRAIGVSLLPRTGDERRVVDDRPAGVGFQIVEDDRSTQIGIVDEASPDGSV